MFLSVKTDSLSVKRHIKAQNFRAQEATSECSMYALSLISQKEDILHQWFFYYYTIIQLIIYSFTDSSRIYWALALCDAPKKMPQWDMNSALGELAVLTSAVRDDMWPGHSTPRKEGSIQLGVLSLEGWDTQVVSGHSSQGGQCEGRHRTGRCAWKSCVGRVLPSPFSFLL